MSYLNLPNILTLLRIFTIPVVVIVYYLPTPWAHPAAAVVFALAAITDWLDGYIARSWSQTTRLGAFLDPVADKLMVAVSLVIVVGEQQIPFLAVPASIIVGREIVISALREWMAEIGKRTSVAVSFVGKVKTGFQLAALILLLWTHPTSSLWIGLFGSILLYISAVLTLWSMFIYLRLAWPDLTMSKEKE